MGPSKVSVVRSAEGRSAGAGFALVELLVALVIMLLVTAAVLAIVNPSRARFATELESVDMEQRVRVAADTLTRDLSMAGSGLDLQGESGPLIHAFPPILPFRQGATADDPPGTFRSDTLTLFYVPSSAARSTLTAPVGPGYSTLQVASHSGCPAGSALCGFTAGMTVVVYDDSGGYDTFTLASASGGVGTLRVNRPGGAMETTFDVGSRVAQAVQRTYYLKNDASQQTSQLMRYDGTTNPGVPVADHVVALQFEYLGEPRPPVVMKPVTEADGPWTTYGSPPPPAGVQRLPYPAGESCLFIYDTESARHYPKLVAMPPGASLVPLTASELADGPFWCPDGVSARRYDADLLRIRSVVVTIRVQAAAAAFRGPAGSLFVNQGTSTSAHRYLPDREVRFRVSPRNLALSR